MREGANGRANRRLRIRSHAGACDAACRNPLSGKIRRPQVKSLHVSEAGSPASSAATPTPLRFFLLISQPLLHPHMYRNPTTHTPIHLDRPPPIIHPPSQFPGHSLQSVAQHLIRVCVRKEDSVVAMASMTAAMVGSSVVAAAPASLSSSSVFGSSCGVSSFAPVATRASGARSVAVRASQSSNEVRDCCILSFLGHKRVAL
jgi:hypothetical protein